MSSSGLRNKSRSLVDRGSGHSWRSVRKPSRRMCSVLRYMPYPPPMMSLISAAFHFVEQVEQGRLKVGYGDHCRTGSKSSEETTSPAQRSLDRAYHQPSTPSKPAQGRPPEGSVLSGIKVDCFILRLDEFEVRKAVRLVSGQAFPIASPNVGSRQITNPPRHNCKFRDDDVPAATRGKFNT